MRDVVADALAAACVATRGLDRRVLAHVAGPLGAAARAAAAELVALDDRARRAQRVTWAAAARSPVPPGLRGIDPSWIEATLEEVPARTREVLATGAHDPASVWLVRRACAALPPLPAIDAARVRPDVPAEVAVLAPVVLRAWLEDVGADQLAFALGAQATALPTIGPRLAVACARIGRAPRAGQLGERRAAIVRAQLPLDDHALVRLGARAVASHLGPLDRARVAVRFDRALGRVLVDELRAYAADRSGPAWAALACYD